MNRKLPYDSCRRRSLPARLRADILVRQDGCCADCSTRLILGSFVFDHRPPLSLRDTNEDANDPDRLAAICRRCDERKTPQDLKAIARTKRLAFGHQDFLAGQRSKVPGRRAPSRRQFEQLQRSMIRPLQHTPPQAIDAPTRHRAPPSLPPPKDKKD